MKILKVDVSNTVGINNGVGSIKMNRLGDVVLLAGKNGSGKTRILKKIFELLKQKPTTDNLFQWDKSRKELDNELRNVNRNISEIEGLISKSQDSEQIKNLEHRLHSDLYLRSKDLNSRLIGLRNSLDNPYCIETSEIAPNYNFVYFVPKALELHDYEKFSKNDIKSNSTSIDSVGIERLSVGTLSKIHVIQENYFNATHPESTASRDEIKTATKEYERLKELIKFFLGAELGRNGGETTLFDFPLGKANFSDGQIVLLQFCLAIYSQEANLRDLILIMDEPENHLHPDIIIKTIEKIRSFLINGQIWIATHSVPLLAHFDPSFIWYVESGNIKHGGRIPEKVLSSLLGNEGGIQNLNEFTGLPAQLASNRFAFECLFDPPVVMTQGDDPQVVQIRQDLLNIGSNGKLKFLDFGAGKGRLITNLLDIDQENQDSLISVLDYVAYDEYVKDKNDCENSIAKVYKEVENRYYNKMEDLVTFHGVESFDVVLMCNVLHEIEYKKWYELFSKDGIIYRLLKEDGVLLLVEDMLIPTGEKAYQNGFLILDTQHLRKLFKIRDDEKLEFSDARKNGRLKGHFIKKEYLMRIDDNSIKDAIIEVGRTSKSEIIRIRELNEQNYINGKLHGFWTQQFANSQLILDEIKAGQNN